MHATVFIVMWTELNNFMFLTERTTIFKKHCVLLHDSFYDGIILEKFVCTDFSTVLKTDFNMLLKGVNLNEFQMMHLKEFHFNGDDEASTVSRKKREQ